MSRTLIDTFVQRLTTLVRGPAHLREDIADEIADHLASRIDEETAHAGSNPDAARIEAEAIRAFGDPQQIARELRNIHMGDWIMFQKIMVAALVVIVIGMAATAYFSWSAARDQARQLEGMNKQLTALVELQQTAPQRALDAAAQREAAAKAEEEKKRQEQMKKAAAPKAKLYFYVGDKSKPAVDYPVEIMLNLLGYTSTERTNEKGLISLPAGKHQIKGAILPPEGVRYAGQATWSRVVEIGKDGMPEVAFEVNVSPESRYELELDLSSVTWNRDVPRKLSVEFSAQENPIHWGQPGPHGTPSFANSWWNSWTYSFEWPQTGKLKAVTGLYPGKAVAKITFQPRAEDVTWKTTATAEEREKLNSWPFLVLTKEVVISEGSSTILMKLEPERERRVSGVVYEGSRERAVANQEIGIRRHFYSPSAVARGDFYPGSAAENVVTEYLRTNALGEFVLLESAPETKLRRGSPQPASAQEERTFRIAWHTPDGREVPFIWPLDQTQTYQLTNDGRFHEIDMAKVGTARLVFEGMDELLNSGCTLARPLEITDMRYRSGGSNLLNEYSLMARSFDVLKSRTADLLMFESSSVTEKQSTGSQPASAPVRSRRTTPVPVGTNPHPKELNSVTLQFVTSRPKEGSPDLVAERTYTRTFSFAVAGGRITEIAVPLDKLSEWDASEPKWRRVEAATQTAPE